MATLSNKGLDEISLTIYLSNCLAYAGAQPGISKNWGQMVVSRHLRAKQIYVALGNEDKNLSIMEFT